MKTLKQLRIEAGYQSMREFASAVKILESSWYNLETGLAYFKNLPIDKQDRISKALNARLSDLRHDVIPNHCMEYKIDPHKAEELLKQYGEKLQPIKTPLSERKSFARLANLSIFGNNGAF